MVKVRHLSPSPSTLIACVGDRISQRSPGWLGNAILNSHSYLPLPLLKLSVEIRGVHHYAWPPGFFWGGDGFVLLLLVFETRFLTEPRALPVYPGNELQGSACPTFPRMHWGYRCVPYSLTFTWVLEPKRRHLINGATSPNPHKHFHCPDRWAARQCINFSCEPAGAMFLSFNFQC